MNRFQSQIIYGILLLITGIIIVLLSYHPSRAIQYVLAEGMFLASIFAFITARRAAGNEIPMKYNRIQGIGMMAYALVIFIYASTFERFITVTMFFLLLFGITELLFGFLLMSYKTRISLAVITLRMITGFLMTIGAVLILLIAFRNKGGASLLFAGLLIAWSGVNFILFANAARKPGQPN